MDVEVGHKSEASRFVRPLVLKNNAVLNLAKVLEVGSELVDFEVMRQATDEHFSQLSIDQVAAHK